MIICRKYNSVNKGFLLGFADMYIEKWKIEIRGCALYQKDGRRWINLPSKEYVDELGAKKYAPIVRFEEDDHYKLFQEQAKRAIDQWVLENAQEPPPVEEPTENEPPLPF